MVNETNTNCSEDKRPQCWVARSLKHVGSLYPQVFFVSKARVKSIKFVFTEDGEAIPPTGIVEYEDPIKIKKFGFTAGKNVYVEGMSIFSKTIYKDYESCRKYVDELNEDLVEKIVKYYKNNGESISKDIIEKEAQKLIKLARTLEACFDRSLSKTIESCLGNYNKDFSV